MFPFSLELSEAQNVLLIWNSVICCFVPVHNETKSQTSELPAISSILMCPSAMSSFIMRETLGLIKSAKHSLESRAASILWYASEQFVLEIAARKTWITEEQRERNSEAGWNKSVQVCQAVIFSWKECCKKVSDWLCCEKCHNFVQVFLISLMFWYVPELGKNTVWLSSSFAWV